MTSTSGNIREHSHAGIDCHLPKILLITDENILHPCFRLRLGYFLDYLKKQKRIADYYINDIYHYSMADVVVIQRNATLTPELVRHLIDNPKHVIYETDDLLQSVPFHILPQSHRSSITAKLKLYGSWNATFIASTPYLADKMRMYAKDVNVIFNAPPFIFSNNLRNQKKEREMILIGFLGSPVHLHDFTVLGNTLERVADKYKNIRYLFIGDTPRNLKQKLPIDYCPFNNDYQTTLNRFRSYRPDIGIAPLLDNQCNRAKSVIKYIDYTYSGAVGVYSNVIPYRGVNGGILAKNYTEQWFEGICRLVENPQLRNQMHKAAVKEIKNDFSFIAESGHLYDILARVAKTNPPSSKDRVKEAVRLTRQAKDSGEILEFLEYVRLCYPVCLKGRIAAREILDIVDKIDFEKYSNTRLITDVFKTVGDMNGLKSFTESRCAIFLSQAYSRVRHMELEMYWLASTTQAKGELINSSKIFKRILSKSSEIKVRAGAAFHLGEIALKGKNFSIARNFFAECIMSDPDHRKAQEYLHQLTQR
jgi:glycosyltransferase involved in cell wall biosynthesis